MNFFLLFLTMKYFLYTMSLRIIVSIIGNEAVSDPNLIMNKICNAWFQRQFASLFKEHFEESCLNPYLYTQGSNLDDITQVQTKISRNLNLALFYSNQIHYSRSYKTAL